MNIASRVRAIAFALPVIVAGPLACGNSSSGYKAGDTKGYEAFSKQYPVLAKETIGGAKWLADNKLTLNDLGASDSWSRIAEKLYGKKEYGDFLRQDNNGKERISDCRNYAQDVACFLSSDQCAVQINIRRPSLKDDGVIPAASASASASTITSATVPVASASVKASVSPSISVSHSVKKGKTPAPAASANTDGGEVEPNPEKPEE